MKVIVASDTHGYFLDLSNYILENDDIDLLIHAGDGVDDVRTIHMESNIPYYVVRGNNDYDFDIPYEEVIELNGIKIFLTHGHNYHVNLGYDEILSKAKSLDADIAIFGHTHHYYNEDHEDIRLLNPGSVSLARDNNPGFMILNTDKDNFDLKRIKL